MQIQEDYFKTIIFLAGKCFFKVGSEHLLVSRCLQAVYNMRVPQRSDYVKIIYLDPTETFDTVLLFETLYSLPESSLS